MNKRSQSRSAARLAAVQALYQHEMEGTPVAKLIHEFHMHRIGATIEDAEYADADVEFFDDIVKGTLARSAEIDAAIVARLASGWSMERLDRTMKAILRAGSYELMARSDVPIGAVVSEYVDVAKAFFDAREAGFANGLLDAIGKNVRKSA
ncbi:transcription antitermination factor NusB [Sphingopyxis witflariensis]|uniref:Transcription antitermination protein NusB n=1 Tax=Sphingopyxis witflariensis TaxID=173675 RepID=A0A246JTG3_9SPHN|nr:transcription antitermination factor NusB [Sphingopyxis witflariensis]OWQ96304.1 transcription antitermination factor NusB [Sphingopyxis witflariensis]